MADNEGPSESANYTPHDAFEDTVDVLGSLIMGSDNKEHNKKDDNGTPEKKTLNSAEQTNTQKTDEQKQAGSSGKDGESEGMDYDVEDALKDTLGVIGGFGMSKEKKEHKQKDKQEKDKDHKDKKDDTNADKNHQDEKKDKHHQDENKKEKDLQDGQNKEKQHQEEHKKENDHKDKQNKDNTNTKKEKGGNSDPEQSDKSDAQTEIGADDYRAQLKAAFDTFDKDGSGTIERSELKLILGGNIGMTDQELDEILNMMDTDKSGNLNFDEMVDVLAAQNPDIQ